MERKQIQKRPMFWRWVIVLALSIGFGMEWLPPEGRSMVDGFGEKAINIEDGKFDLILEDIKAAATEAQGLGGELTLEKWEQAIDNASLTNYFPLTGDFKTDKAAREKMGLDEKAFEKHGTLSLEIPEDIPDSEKINLAETSRKAANRFVLGKLQSMAAGKVKLGLDLRGGTQFTVRIVSAGKQADSAKRKTGWNRRWRPSANESINSAYRSPSFKVLRTMTRIISLFKFQASQRRIVTGRVRPSKKLLNWNSALSMLVAARQSIVGRILFQAQIY